jgi:hypothetical protein
MGSKILQKSLFLKIPNNKNSPSPLLQLLYVLTFTHFNVAFLVESNRVVDHMCAKAGVQGGGGPHAREVADNILARGAPT